MPSEKLFEDIPESFVQQLTERQNSLFAYLAALLGDLHAARDVLQETNLVLWRKAKEFTPGTSFEAWARAIAYHQTLAYLRDRKRDRHLFDDELLAQLAARAQPAPEEDERRLALRDCLARLPEEQRQLLAERYCGAGSVNAMAQRLGKSPGAIKMMLARIRRSLIDCVAARQGSA